MTETAPRLFTREEAERTLPLVRRIVADLMAEHPAWRRAISHYEILAAGAVADEGETPEVRAARADAERLASQIDSYLREIEQIGCMFQGFEEGLVDFRTMRDDRMILLCWRYGEERISHWHEVGAGFAGRKPIDDALLSEVG
jgi:hypothetical protein